MEDRRSWWRRLEPASAGLALLCFAWTVPILLGWFGPIGTTATAYVRAGALTKELLWAGESWRLLTTLFVHGGWLHLALNALSLYLVGSYVARSSGKRAFFFFVIVSAAGGHAAGLFWTQPHDLNIARVGISGALFGLLGEVLAAEWCFKRSPRAFLKSSTVRIVLFFLALNAILGLLVKGIDNAAHAGGFVTGLLVGLVFYWSKRRRPRLALLVALVIPGLPLYYAAAPWDSAPYQYLRARVALLSSDADEIEQAYERILHVDPNLKWGARKRRETLVKVLYFVAEARIETDLIAAKELMYKAWALPVRQTFSGRIWVRLGSAAERAEDFETAEDAYRKGLSRLAGEQRWQAGRALAVVVARRLDEGQFPQKERLTAARSMCEAAQEATGLLSEESEVLSADQKEAFYDTLARIAKGARAIMNEAARGPDRRDEVRAMATELGRFIDAIQRNLPDEDPRIGRLQFEAARLMWEGVQGGAIPPETDERIQGLFGAALRRARKAGDRLVVMGAEAWFRGRGLPIPE
ncbi:MAG: rhomboid family intramembrane serine protease [Planctomycetota bacterium]|nr:rhomboid family intramembrane serine protease [Planctomycetota bacterium]